MINIFFFVLLTYQQFYLDGKLEYKRHFVVLGSLETGYGLVPRTV
jgi:hypothetical protein